MNSLRGRPGPSQLSESSLTRLIKPYTTRTPYKTGGSLRFDPIADPSGEQENPPSTIPNSAGPAVNTHAYLDPTTITSDSPGPDKHAYSLPLKPAFPELLRQTLKYM